MKIAILLYRVGNKIEKHRAELIFFLYSHGQSNFGKNVKESGPTVLVGLPGDAYSQARTHYCPTRGLLPAAFPPSAGSSLLRQPGDNPSSPRATILMPSLVRTPDRHRTSTRTTPHPRPPSSWITGVRHDSQPINSL